MCGSAVKNMPANTGGRETWVGALGWEEFLEEEIITHSSILAWKIPWIEDLGGLLFIDSRRVRKDCMPEHTQKKHTTHTHTHTYIYYIYTKNLVGRRLLI